MKKNNLCSVKMLILLVAVVFITLYFKTLQYCWNASVVPLFNLKEASTFQVALLYVLVVSVLRQSSSVNCVCSSIGETEHKQENQLLS